MMLMVDYDDDDGGGGSGGNGHIFSIRKYVPERERERKKERETVKNVRVFSPFFFSILYYGP